MGPILPDFAIKSVTQGHVTSLAFTQIHRAFRLSGEAYWWRMKEMVLCDDGVGSGIWHICPSADILFSVLNGSYITYYLKLIPSVLKFGEKKAVRLETTTRPSRSTGVQLYQLPPFARDGFDLTVSPWQSSIKLIIILSLNCLGREWALWWNHLCLSNGLNLHNHHSFFCF